MKRKHYLAWMLTAALTAASVMPMTVYAQPASAGGGKVKVVEGDVSGRDAGRRDVAGSGGSRGR